MIVRDEKTGLDYEVYENGSSMLIPGQQAKMNCAYCNILFMLAEQKEFFNEKYYHLNCLIKAKNIIVLS